MGAPWPHLIEQLDKAHHHLATKDSPQIISVELTRERYRELKLRQGDVVFVRPKQLQVFRMPGPPPV